MSIFRIFILQVFVLVFPFTLLAESWQERIIEDAKVIYSNEVLKELGKPLEFNIISGASVTASAKHDFDKLAVELFTGLLENPKLTPDSLRMIICHELGHLFGGAPRRNLPMDWDGPVGEDGMSLLSSEGQADYYASSSCFKRMLTRENQNEKKQFNFSRVGPVLRNKCQNIAGFSHGDLEICFRSALAALDFLQLNFNFPISCEFEDKNVAPVLIRDSYPDRQCRLDTMVNGTLCSEKLPLLMDPFNESKNTCLSQFAKRPKCWFP